MQITKFFKTSFCVGLLALIFVKTQAASITNADAAVNLNLGGSWIGGIPAGPADVAVWDNTVQVNGTKALGANLTWAGIQILNPATAITISAGNTLTNGASGIDLSLATNGLTLSCPMVLGANQTWNVTNGQTLTVAGVVSGIPSCSQLTLNNGGNFGGTIILGAANTFTNNVVISNGVVMPGGAASFGPGVSANIVTISGTTLLLSNYAASAIIANTFNVTGTNILDMFNRNISAVLDGRFMGSGTLYITNDTASGSTLTFGGNGASGSGNGDFNNFTGALIIVTNASGTTSAGTLRFNNGGTSANIGNALMTLDLGQSSIHFTEKNSGTTTSFGALFGGPNTQLAQPENYAVGGLNLINDIFSGASTGAASTFTKNGTGTFIWNNTSANTYTGITTVNNGILQIGDGVTTAAGALGTGPIVINTPGILIYNKPDNFTINNKISGSGTLIQTNIGTLTYNGTNSASGTTIISQGNFLLGALGLMSCPIFVAGGATFDISQNPTFILNQTLSGFGTVTGLVTAAGATINPGGSGAAGVLSFSNGLTEVGNVNHQMELSSAGSTNDLINIVGDLTVSGTNNITLLHFGGGTIPNGTYTLINYSGNFNGGLTNFAVIAPGGNAGVLGNPPNEITITIGLIGRGPTNLTWVGDGGANNWDVGTSNWINGATLIAYQTGDSVRFDNTGAANPIINLNITVLPASMTVSNTTSYTLSGSGNISGLTGLIKTNSGTLNLLTVNSYTGPTVIGGGTVTVSNLANGGSSSGIGAASSNPTNLMFWGTTLSYIGPTAGTDRGATLNGSGGIFDVIGGTTLTLNGTLTGAGALTLIDIGTLTLANPNTYSGGTVISNGVLALGSNNANNNGTGISGVGPTNQPVIFDGGTLQLYGYGLSSGNNYNSFYNPLIVAAGQVGTLIMFPRGAINTGAGAGLNSSLSGSGTLNLEVNYVRDAISGNWSAFTGLINVTNANPAGGDEFRINNNFGYSNAVIYLAGNIIMDSTLTAGATINIGELGGINTATIGPGNASQLNPNWSVGWKNTTNVFAGTIANDGATSITKVGTGIWYLSGQNTYTGSTVISNGVLALTNGVNGDGSIGNSTNIFINASAFLDVSGRSDGTMPLNSGQVISGNGTVRGILDNTAGGTVSPGGGIAGNLGVLTVKNSINLGGGGTAWMKVNRASIPNSDKLVSSLSSITYGGVLLVTNIGARLQVGDTFTLFSASSLPGSFNLQLPTYYTWDTSQLSVNGSITVTGAFLPAIARVDFSDLANGNLYLYATNGQPGGGVDILTTTNLALPISQWMTNTSTGFDGNGQINHFYLNVDPSLPQQFIILHGY